ncbi:hypothetical protein BLNAU_1446 [Blattamonas nauphoetae]|uniref:Uncharacterized protein n=1 Tax=Blattamonas nauphoetae TaxID=2049346 RepID=A0ABQ9YI42_9EUKA|nr:hypothetical protein BLNAU_1446 [Blattamonas nauphoetae]
MPSPPSHGSDDEDDLLSESSISRKEQSVERGHRVLNLIHEIRARRINTGETDWDATSFRDSGEFYESEIVPRDHFDDTIFDLVNRFDIIHLLIECNSIIERIGNLNHVSLTHTYLSKLTHFIISETGSFGDTAATHLSLLLFTVPDPGEIVWTVFPLLRNAFQRSNEHACHSLLCVVIKEIEMDGMSSVILGKWTESDWIAVFSHRWIHIHYLRHFLTNVIPFLGHTHHYRQSPSTSDLSLVRLFSASNNIISRSETLPRIFSRHELKKQNRQFIISAVMLCHAAMNERLPSSIHDALVHFHIADPSFSTLPLLFMINQSNSQISRFLPSFPADIVIERELSRILLKFHVLSMEHLMVLCNLFAPDDYLLFLHPFILRGLGSVLRHNQVSKTSQGPHGFQKLIMMNAHVSPSLDDTVQLFILYPSDQIVEFSIALLLDLYEGLPFPMDIRKLIWASLPFLTTLASHSAHTASATSLNRWFNTFLRLFSNPNEYSEELESALWLLLRQCLTQLGLSIPPFAFESLFREASLTFSHFPARFNPFSLGPESLKLFKKFNQTEMWSIEDLSSFDERKAGWSNSCRGLLRDLVSHIPANRNAALVLLSKMYAQASLDEVLDLCRFGVVECVMRAVEASSSLEEYEMGISILGSLFQTLAFSASIDEMTSFDFSTLFEQFRRDSLT